MEHSIRAAESSPVYTMSGSTGGTGSRFARAVTIVAGVAALVATILTFLYVTSSCTSALSCQLFCLIQSLTLYLQINMAPKVCLIAIDPHRNQVLTRLAKTIASRFYSAMLFAS